MSSISSTTWGLLSLGLVMTGGYTGASVASTFQDSYRVQASFQNAARVGTATTLVNTAAPNYAPRVTVVTPRYNTYVPNAGLVVVPAATVNPNARRFLPLNRLAANAAVERNRAIARAAAAARGVDPAERVINAGSRQLGKKYRWGGEAPNTGFDCSGLVQYSMKAGAGVALPRTAADQYAVSTKVPYSQALRGDLVFFKTTRARRVSHVGIYLGNNVFLHAPRKGKRIERAAIQGYWQKKLIGFGRIPGACKVPAFYG